jgi:hypothetical protein
MKDFDARKQQLQQQYNELHQDVEELYKDVRSEYHSTHRQLIEAGCQATDEDGNWLKGGEEEQNLIRAKEDMGKMNDIEYTARNMKHHLDCITFDTWK